MALIITPDVTSIVTGANPPINGNIILAGTANQISIAQSGQTFTFSTPQDIGTGSSPTFTGLTLSSFTQGSVLFAGASGVISQDNSNFFWDDTNNFLGVGTAATPIAPIHALRTSAETTAVAVRTGLFNLVADPLISSASSFITLDVLASLGNTGTTNVTGGVAGSRYLASNGRQTGTLQALNGLTLQAISGVIFGASSGTATSLNITAGTFQAVNNSQTTTDITGAIVGGAFSAEQRGTGVMTTAAVAPGLFTSLIAGGTTTTMRDLWTRHSTVFGNTYTGGTITNAYSLDMEGYPAGPTYTNTPVMIRLQSGATTAIAFQQLGTAHANRMQGSLIVGANAANSTGVLSEVKDGNLGLTNTGTAGVLRLYEPSASGTNFTGFTAQAQAGDVTYTLPAADGTAEQALCTNGTGTLSWQYPTKFFIKRMGNVMAGAGATTIITYGSFQNLASKAFSVQTNADDADGIWLSLATSNVSGNVSSILGNFGEFRRQWEPIMITYFKTDPTVITSVRYWVGMFSATPSGSATPAVHIAAFRYDTGSDGTAFWRTVTDNGSGTPTVTTTTTAIAANTAYRLRIDCSNTTPDVKFYINNILVATHTGTLPTATQALGIAATCTTLSAAIRALKFGSNNTLYN